MGPDTFYRGRVMPSDLVKRLRAHARTTYSASRQSDLNEAADWIELLEAEAAAEKAREFFRRPPVQWSGELCSTMLRRCDDTELR